MTFTAHAGLMVDVNAAVTQKLGAATNALYAEIGALIEMAAAAGASAGETRLGLACIGLDVLCGKFHDYRAGAPNPKGDLVEALRAVPPHRSVSDGIAALVRRVLLQEFEDGPDEARRYVARVAPAGHVPWVPSPVDQAPIELTPRQWKVFAWLYRYTELHGETPTLGELALGLSMADTDVADVLRKLEAKGAVARLGGKRGWVPLRCP